MLSSASRRFCGERALLAGHLMRIKRNPNPPRRCIFCGGTPISKEHIWPAWMRPYLPAGQFAQFIRSSDLRGPIPQLRAGPLNRKGDGRSQKLKVVCRPCNNNWMSVLQDRTKATLVPLLLNDIQEISEPEHELLATWATMFTMVYETCQPNPVRTATTGAQRSLFKAEQKPPQHWIFWCAPHDGVSSPIFHTGFGSVRRLADPETVEPGKASLTTCAVGAISLAILGVNSDYGFQAFSHTITMLVERAGFVRLWPSLGRNISVLDRRISPLSRGDLGQIHHALRAFIEMEVTATRARRSPADNSHL